jgi:hypothetical protein
LEEFEKVLDAGVFVEALAFEEREGFVERAGVGEEDLAGGFEGLNVGVGIAGPAKADFVQAAKLVGPVDLQEGRDVVVDCGAGGDVGTLSEGDEVEDR